MKTIKFAFALALIAAFLLFVVQNLDTVKVQFLTWEAELSLALPLAAAYLLGALTLRAVLRFLNNRRKDRKVDKKVAAARREGATAAAARDASV
jgi:uncharacterized integral membrane protein